jgi:hypothetical protein
VKVPSTWTLDAPEPDGRKDRVENLHGISAHGMDRWADCAGTNDVLANLI